MPVRRKRRAPDASGGEVSPRGDTSEVESTTSGTEADPFADEVPFDDGGEYAAEDDAPAQESTSTTPPANGASKPAAAKPAPAVAASTSSGGGGDQPGPRGIKMPTPWGNVVTDVFAIDIDATYKRLSDDLSLGNDITQYGVVLAALDASGRNAWDAARLTRAAKLADADVAAEIDERLEVLRSTARAQLDAEKTKAKKDGGAAKAASIQEVRDRMIANWPDEVHALEQRKAYMHGAFRAIEALEKAWWDRAQSLRKVADRFTARTAS